jgi:predicted DNA-binding protein (UPF0251 family)
MPKRKRLRRIVTPPGFIGFKPYGVNKISEEQVKLFYEEYEALKLSDYDGLNHENAAKKMGISRPTFARIYENARKKIAKALVETKEIKTEYGNALLEKKWYVCNNCFARYTVLSSKNNSNCIICSSDSVEALKIKLK